MVSALIVVSVFLAVAVAGAGFLKLLGVPELRASARQFGIPFAVYRVLGGLEILGALGVLVALWRFRHGDPNLGILSASCLLLIVVGAIAAHAHAADAPAQWAPAATIAVIVCAFVGLRIVG